MKRLIFLLIVAICGVMAAQAQKFALIDMEYVLSNYPAYEMANEQLNQYSRTWQTEVEKLQREAETLYKNYQNEMVFLTDEQKKQREEAVLAKEKEGAELRNKYFGPEGMLYKERQRQLQPIQDEIYTAVKAICESRGYMVVFDRASSADIIFASPKIDISDEVLAKLGYSR